MLDHDEERQLAEIEARLRDEAPDLLELFDEIPGSPEALGPLDPLESITSESAAHTGHPTSHPLLKSVAALVTAIALTTLVTLAVGPDLGGLIGVIALSIAGMYAYQVLRGCPGLRNRGAD
jgi:hypothetical protein